jgi:hypothetical protein
MPYFPQPEVDEMVWAKVEEMISNPAILWDAVYGKGTDTERIRWEGRIAGLRQRLVQARAQEERAARLFTLGASHTVAHQQVKEAVSRRRSVELELNQAEKNLSSVKARKDIKEKAFSAIVALRDRVGDLTLHEKRRILRTLVPGGLTHHIKLHTDETIQVQGCIDFDAVNKSAGVPYMQPSYFS